MLPRPSILKIPDASSALGDGLNGCNSGYSGGGTQCQSGFKCTPISGGSCVDSSYSSGGCGDPLTVGGIAVGVVVTVAIAT